MLFDATQARRRQGPQGRFDLPLLVALVGLACVGLVMITSSSIAVADSQHLGAFYFLKKHLMFLGLGMTSHSLVPKAAKVVGIDYQTLCWRVLETSFREDV